MGLHIDSKLGIDEVTELGCLFGYFEGSKYRKLNGSLNGISMVIEYGHSLGS